jgi:hypothetical protein
MNAKYEREVVINAIGASAIPAYFVKSNSKYIPPVEYSNWTKFIGITFGIVVCAIIVYCIGLLAYAFYHPLPPPMVGF